MWIRGAPATKFGERFKCGGGSHQRLGGIKPWRCERAPRPSEGTPKGGTHVLAVCATPGQLNDCVAVSL